MLTVTGVVGATLAAICTTVAPQLSVAQRWPQTWPTASLGHWPSRAALPQSSGQSGQEKAARWEVALAVAVVALSSHVMEQGLASTLAGHSPWALAVLVASALALPSPWPEGVPEVAQEVA